MRPLTAPAMTLLDSTSLSPAELNALLLRVGKEQDKQAFSTLFDHFAPRLNGYMRRLGSEPSQAEEWVQEAMLAIWRQASRFDPAKASAATWVYTIARNKRIDALRKHHHPEIDPTDIAFVNGEAANHLLDTARQQQEIERAISTLPPEQAELLRLSFFEDKPHAEIASARGLPLGTVKSRLRLALEKMRLALISMDR